MLILFSDKLTSDIRIQIILPIIPVGLIGIASLLLVSNQFNIFKNILLVFNALGFIGASFYSMHLPFGLLFTLIWLLARLYVNYEIFTQKIELPKNKFDNLIINIIVLGCAIQAILILTKYWIVSIYSGSIAILLSILMLIALYRKSQKSWLKDFIIQVGIQNIFIVFWNMSKFLK